MADPYDKEKVAEFMRQNSRVARLESNPAVQERFATIFRQNGWAAEPGKSEFQTFVEWARAADAGRLNGERELLTDKKLDSRQIAEAIAERANVGTPSDVRRALDRVASVDAQDGLFERMAKHDHKVDPLRPRATDATPSSATISAEQIRNQMGHRARELEAARPTVERGQSEQPTAPRNPYESIRAVYEQRMSKETKE